MPLGSREPLSNGESILRWIGFLFVLAVVQYVQLKVRLRVVGNK